MKIFNSVLGVVLLIAVAFLFWKEYGATPDKKKGITKEQLSENLEEQKFRGVSIAYINTDSLVEKYDYHKELKVKLEAKAKQLESDLARKSKVFQENVSLLQAQADRMSDDELQAAQMDLQQTQQQLMMYRDEKTQELAAEEQELNMLIKEDMEGILENIKEEFGLDFIMSYDPSSILLAANENYNISDLVLERLNAKYQEKSTKKEVPAE